MASTIQLKTGTGSAVPSSLSQGEVGINITDGLIYYGSGSGNNVKQLESFTNVTASGDISSSGTLYGKYLTIGDPSLGAGNIASFRTATGTYTIDAEGTFSGVAATVATIAGLAPNTATTQATQGNITSIANLSTVGTIGTGVWQGTAIASAYLDSDTAHLTTDQTFTGNKTFSSAITASGAISASSHISASGGVGAGFVVRPNLYWFANCDAVTATVASTTVDGDFPSTNTATASFGETFNSNSSVFSLADDALTISRAGLYKFTYNITLEVKSHSNRTEGAAAIVRTPDGGSPGFISGSVVHTYNRLITPDVSRTTGTATVLINVSTDDTFKILFVRYVHTGSSTTRLQTVPRATSWYIEAVT